MDERIISKAKRIVKDFEDLKIYHDFQRLERALVEDESLKNLNEAIVNLKKNLCHYQGATLIEAKSELKRLEVEYHMSPIVTNYEALKKELEELTKPLKELLL